VKKEFDLGFLIFQQHREASGRDTQYGYIFVVTLPKQGRTCKTKIWVFGQQKPLGVDGFRRLKHKISPYHLIK